MAVDLMNLSKITDQIAMKEAAIASLQSMEALVLTLGRQSSSSFDCSLIADNTVSKFKKFIHALDRTGHARFRRGPAQSPSESFSPQSPPPPVNVAQQSPISPPTVNFQPQGLTLDFTMPNHPTAGKITGKRQFTDDTFSISPPISGNSFMSSITADGHTVSNGRPPFSSSKKKCNSSGAGGQCHCSKKKKNRLRRSIRIPAISSKVADIPKDSYSWRKYGQKPIKGSPHPSPYDSRAYYRCSSMRDCPARKLVERAFDDLSMLIVTYEEEHRHVQHVLAFDESTGTCST